MDVLLQGSDLLYAQLAPPVRITAEPRLEEHDLLLAAIGADGPEAPFALMLGPTHSKLFTAEHAFLLFLPVGLGLIFLEIVAYHRDENLYKRCILYTTSVQALQIL